MLHVRGYSNGFCFMWDDKAVSVQEALLKNGKVFHKRTINALNRNNLPNPDFHDSFEKLAKILHTGLDAAGARQVLRNHFDLDIIKIDDYYQLTSSQVHDLKTVYAISKYKVTVKNPAHSPMYYFYQYLSRKDVHILEIL